ncbi:MAG: lipase/acyltransferase domain-containing protein [Egibacteraceae bacterium]
MALRHLIVVIPGIGGSVLERGGQPVWGDGPRRAAARVLDPETLALSPGDGVRAVGLIRTASIVPGWTVMHGYAELVRQICIRFAGVRVDEGHPDRPVPNADVVAFPYDFRQSVEVAAERLAATVEARLAERDRRVVVIAHSMGGLVARYWLGPLKGWPRCRALITLGTPHRGAPKALAWLVNGVRLKGVQLRAATEVIRGWPSVYELLPRYPAVLREGTACHPHELAVDGFGYQRRARDALTLHRRIEDAWQEVPAPPVGPSVRPFLGRGHPTLERATWAGALSVTKDPAEWLDQPADWFGDGTVPAYMASPIEQGNQRDLWDLVPVRHGALASHPGVIKRLETISSESEDESKIPVRGEDDARPCLGVDVEEWYPAGEAVPLEVFLRPALRRPAEELDVRGARVWASVAPEHGGGAGHPDPEKLDVGGARVWVVPEHGGGKALPDPVELDVGGARVWASVAPERSGGAGHPDPEELDVGGARVWASVAPEHGGGKALPDHVELERAGDRWVGELGGLAPGLYRLTVEGRRVPGGEPPSVREVFEVVEFP